LLSKCGGAFCSLWDGVSCFLKVSCGKTGFHVGVPCVIYIFYIVYGSYLYRFQQPRIS
jgi:hypothetical protein